MEQLSKRLYERVLGAEMTHYLGYEKGQAPKLAADQERENHRNGTSKKTIVSDDGKLEIEDPETVLGTSSRSLSVRGKGGLAASIRKSSPCTPKV
jgi:putative transposase